MLLAIAPRAGNTCVKEQDMGKTMRILALLGVLAAVYFSWRYGLR